MSEKKYEVEFGNGAVVFVWADLDIFTDEYLEDWASVFYNFDAEEHLEHLAWLMLKWPHDPQWEGYGDTEKDGGYRTVDIIEGDGTVLGKVKLFVYAYPRHEGWSATVSEADES